MGPNNKEEGINYNPQVFKVYFVCSHGGSVKQPVLVGERHARWLQSEGIVVYTEEEYLRLARRSEK